MRISFRRAAAIGLSALGLTVFAQSAWANPFLPNVSNLNFVDYTGSAPKDCFTCVNPVGWTGGSGLIFVDAPGTATTGSNPIYGPFPTNSPVGGNFVQADGNPTYESGFNQTITGLTVGTTYTLSFYQAAGQQQGFSGATSEQWVVSLGTSGISLGGAGPVDPIYGPTQEYFNPDPTASIAISQVMNTPSGGITPWEYVSVNITADATTDILSFLAYGDKGSTVNLPPMVFLSGVNSVDVLPGVPEPVSLSIVGLGLAGLAAFRSRRRAKDGMSAA